MTSFLDGPAAGKTLTLRRAPYYLRVTEKDGEWDALDQKDDVPAPGETLHAYQLNQHRGHLSLVFRRQ